MVLTSDFSVISIMLTDSCILPFILLTETSEPNRGFSFDSSLGTSYHGFLHNTLVRHYRRTHELFWDRKNYQNQIRSFEFHFVAFQLDNELIPIL